MSDTSKITDAHLRRVAFVYLRQSSPEQVRRNRESTDRQYQLVERAVDLGWSRDQVSVIDEDQGVTASGVKDRGGFDHMAAQVGFGRVGIVLGIEVSRVARNNAEWYRLLDLCGITDTLIADADGIYHPGHFNDRLLLGLKGTMSEAELHVLRSRLDGGIRNKAARGELRRGLPVGLVWGEGDGEVRFHPDEAVVGAIRTIFGRFAELGSVRQVWLWYCSQGLSFPLQRFQGAEIEWIKPTYTAIHHVMTNPAYAGAYAYGKSHQERYVDPAGRVRKRLRHLPRCEWAVLIVEHHEGFIDWATFEANQERIGANNHPRPHQAGGAVREGAALLQGLAVCGRCGRHLRVHYQGGKSSPGYHCPGRTIVNGRGSYCLRVGAAHVDRAVGDALVAAVDPAGMQAALRAADLLQGDRDGAMEQWRKEAERARYEAHLAERRYRAVDPDNRLVARGLEDEWEKCLGKLRAAEAQLIAREHQHPRALTEQERSTLQALGSDLQRVWGASTTTDRDRKELLRALVEDVTINVDRDEHQVRLTMRWRGGALTDMQLALPRHEPPIRTDEDTVELIRRLVVHYGDDVIAGILNRQGRRSATGERFTATIVCGVRRSWKIPSRSPRDDAPECELATIGRAAKLLGVAPSTVHRWLNDGFLAGEQLTAGAPWRIRMTDDLRSRFIDEEPGEGWLPMLEATQALGVTRQTVLQRIKRGELDAVHLRRGKRRGLRIKVPQPQPTLPILTLSTKDPADPTTV